jgi:hypothetical protein
MKASGKGERNRGAPGECFLISTNNLASSSRPFYALPAERPVASRRMKPRVMPLLRHKEREGFRTSVCVSYAPLSLAHQVRGKRQNTENRIQESEVDIGQR